MNSINRNHPVWRQLPLACLLAWDGLAMATPTGGVVVGGQADITHAPGLTTVTQTTARAAIDWQRFNISAGETVQFIQPSRNAVALNRVTGPDPSSILGRLSSNGQVFVINPNGILFGPSATVDVGGLVASTLNMTPDDFMNERLRFHGSRTEQIHNHGLMEAADGGYIVLIGAHVNNTGTVVANEGHIAMAAGQRVSIDVLGGELLGVEVDMGAANALVSNDGLLQADAGQVLMSTHAAHELLSGAVNNTGLLQAQTVAHRQGRIVLQGARDSGTVNVGGSMDVSGGLAERAGSVMVTGHHVAFVDAHIDASGGVSGGQVWVGGGYQGGDPSVAHAQSVHFNADSVIHADAYDHGDGGQVVVWSDGDTRAHGRLSARGGAMGGDGGFIETSGQWLDLSGLQVDTRAAHGRTGTWLIDPSDITISEAASSDSSTGTTLNVTELVASLVSSNVIVRTDNNDFVSNGEGHIDVNAVLTWTANTTLTLDASHTISVNQAITGTEGSLVLLAGSDINIDAAVTTTTGNLTFSAEQDITLRAATTVTTGDLEAAAGRHINVHAPATVTTGDMVMYAGNRGSGPGAQAGTVSLSCATTCLSVTTGDLSLRFNPVAYDRTDSEQLAYATNAAVGGAIDSKAWVYGQGQHKVYDGTTLATVVDFVPDANDMQPLSVSNGFSQAAFQSASAESNKVISYTSDFSDSRYALFASQQAPAGTYFAYADITPADLTITATNVSKVYGETPVLRDFTASGLVNHESVDSVTLASTGQDALAHVASSPYSIEVSDATGGTFAPGNYTLAYVSGVLTITPADVAPPEVDEPVQPDTPEADFSYEAAQDRIAQGVKETQHLRDVPLRDTLPLMLSVQLSPPRPQGDVTQAEGE